MATTMILAYYTF